MSGSKENFWMEFRICSDLQDELFSIKIDEDDIDSVMERKKRHLQFITRRPELLSIFEKRFPAYLKDSFCHVFQEVEMEHNPYWIEWLLEGKKKKRREGKQVKADIDSDFYKNLTEKASHSKLDSVLISNENNLEDFVYLFKGPRIFKNLVFFNMFQHWFDNPTKAKKIDDVIRQLKKRAGVLKPGPHGFTKNEKIRFIFTYEYLRRVFVKIKTVIKEPFSEGEAEKEWEKLLGYLKEQKYFNIDASKIVTIEKWRKYRPSKYLAQDFLKKDTTLLRDLMDYEMKEDEIQKEIEDYKKDGEGRSESYILMYSLTILKNREASDLAFYFLSKISRASKRQVRSIVDSESKTTKRASMVFSRLPEFN